MFTTRQIGETVVMIKEFPHSLRHRNIQKDSFKLYKPTRNVNGAYEEEMVYEEGRDYNVDWLEGEIRRTENSRILDWSNHIFFGQESFDQSGLLEYSNDPYTVYADYTFAVKSSSISNEALDITAVLPACHARHKSGQSIAYVVFGDSISTGAEASEHRHAYSYWLYERLQHYFPESGINYHMKAIGGETSKDGLSRLSQDVIPLQPQLVTIAYGMNDQNRLQPHRNDVAVADYEYHIRQMIEQLKSQTEADIILVTPCVPNPLWKFSSGEIHRYAETIRVIGRDYSLPVADVHALWMKEIEAGKTYESLLLNNINHPNDYGHFIYKQAFHALWKSL